MDIDRIIGLLLRWCLTMSAQITAWAMQFGRWIQTQIVMRRTSQSVSIALQSARGVPASMPAPAAFAAAMPAGRVSSELPPGENAQSKASQPVTETIKEQQSDTRTDDLDWAGSLSHAAVASQHLSNVLAMVRAGWIILQQERVQDASPAFDAIEAFQIRTALALAPFLEQMTEAQHEEFFSDFDADFPTNLQGIE